MRRREVLYKEGRVTGGEVGGKSYQVGAGSSQVSIKGIEDRPLAIRPWLASKAVVFLQPPTSNLQPPIRHQALVGLKGSGLPPTSNLQPPTNDHHLTSSLLNASVSPPFGLSGITADLSEVDPASSEV